MRTLMFANLLIATVGKLAIRDTKTRPTVWWCESCKVDAIAVFKSLRSILPKLER